MARKTAKKVGKQLDFDTRLRPGKGMSISKATYMQAFKSLNALLREISKPTVDAEEYLTQEFGQPIEVDLRYGKKWLVTVVDVAKGDNGREEFRVAINIRDGGIRVDARNWYLPKDARE